MISGGPCSLKFCKLSTRTQKSQRDQECPRRSHQYQIPDRPLLIKALGPQDGRRPYRINARGAGDSTAANRQSDDNGHQKAADVPPQP